MPVVVKAVVYVTGEDDAAVDRVLRSITAQHDPDGVKGPSLSGAPLYVSLTEESRELES